MAQRVRITSSRIKSFVCQTTPHFGSTSREVSYSVRDYHTPYRGKCKSLISPFLSIFLERFHKKRGWQLRKTPCFLTHIDL